MMEFLGFGAVAAIALLIVLIVAIWAVKSLVIVVPPNQAAVITGRKRVTEDGSQVGYRAVIGGRAFRVPIIETVEWTRLETIKIEIQISNALSKGHIPLNIEAIADVKIASTPEYVFNNAVERLLDKPASEIQELAKDTLTGSLRGVVATLTPEEVNEDRIKFAKAVDEDAHDDLEALGFRLDVLKIQNVSDDKGYLDAIGRERAAVAIKNAKVAEADNESETREREASARQRAEVAEAAADIEVAEAKNRVRVREAELRQEAEAAEKTATVRAEQAEVEAQKALEQRRVETERERYRADVIVPAEANREAAEEDAKANAAPIRERGRAEAEVLRMLYGEIREGGDVGLPVFALEKLPELLDIGVGAVEGIDVDRLVVVDGGDGGGLANAANQRVGAAYRFVEQFAASIGVDVEDLVRGLAGRVGEQRAVPDGEGSETEDDGGGSTSAPVVRGDDGARSN
ncbi:MAG: flotillin family protein [Gemmatimonadota bacterium]